MNSERPQSSALVDLKDPIQVHLLTETALTDSKEYEILSQEEVDGLKKQSQTLAQRIESTRQNLAIQAKFRDAANSMAKLSSPGGRGYDHDDDENEQERLATEQKCEQLAAELFNLEKQLMEPSRRLLEHTAGILQLTHKGDKKKNVQADGQPFNGIPGSPESLYTYTQNRGSLGAVVNPDMFDDAGLYRLSGFDTFRAGGPDLPERSPVRDQRKDEENSYLVKIINDMEQRFEHLTAALRETIVNFNPSVNSAYEMPPQRTPQDSQPGDLLHAQIEYLESGMVAVQAEQSEPGQQPRAAPTSAAPNNIETAERIEELNMSLREVLMRANPDEFPPPMPVEPDVGKQLAYLETSMGVIDAELNRAAARQSTGKTQTVLLGLWDRISTGYAGIKQQNIERRRARADRGMEPEDDISEDEGIDTSEAYTLDGFESRIEWLYRQATTLKDQKSVLKRQIKQQRELNNKSDAEKDEEIANTKEQLEQSRVIASRAEKDAMDAQKMLSEALQDLEEARAGAGATTATRDAPSGPSHEELQEHKSRVTELEALLAGAQQAEQSHATKKAELERQLADVQGSEQSFATREADFHQQLASAQAAEQSYAAREAEFHQQLASAQATEQNYQNQIDEFERQLAEARESQRDPSDFNEHNARISELEDLLAEAQEEERATTAEHAAAAKKLAHAEEVQKKLAAKEAELEDIHVQMAELKTEVTIARAELDGAYGSRAERAADVAAIKSSGEVAKLQNQLEHLKTELSGTVKELEDVTKETIGSEREKTELEAKLDEAHSLKTHLESEAASIRERNDMELEKAREIIHQLQHDLDEERLKVHTAGAGNNGGKIGAGATMLSEQFRATMRDQRKKWQDDLKVRISRFHVFLGGFFPSFRIAPLCDVRIANIS